MIDREKVIKGLDIILNGCNEIQCEDCCFHIKEAIRKILLLMALFAGHAKREAKQDTKEGTNHPGDQGRINQCGDSEPAWGTTVNC